MHNFVKLLKAAGCAFLAVVAILTVGLLAAVVSSFVASFAGIFIGVTAGLLSVAFIIFTFLIYNNS